VIFMELKDTKPKDGKISGSEGSSTLLKRSIGTAVLAAGLAILPSCAQAPQGKMSAAAAPLEMSHSRLENARGYGNGRLENQMEGDLERDKQLAASIVAAGRRFCMSPDTVESKLSETSRSGGVGIQYRTETRVVKQGDSVKVSDIPGSELYMKVVKVADDGIGLSFIDGNRDSVWLVPYGEQRSIGEFVLRITVKAEMCPDGGKALLSVTYPVGYTEMKRNTGSKLEAPGPSSPAAGYTELKRTEKAKITPVASERLVTERVDVIGRMLIIGFDIDATGLISVEARQVHNIGVGIIVNTLDGAHHAYPLKYGVEMELAKNLRDDTIAPGITMKAMKGEGGSVAFEFRVPPKKPGTMLSEMKLSVLALKTTIIPIHAGSNAFPQYADGPKVVKIDAKGVQLDDGSRWDYGQVRRVGEYVLTVEMELRKGPDGSPELEMVAPVVPPMR
jgi:hypothetical protein